MRVLYLSPLAELGGAERSLLDLMASVKRADQAMDLHLVTGSPGPLAQRAAALGATVHLLGLPGALNSLGDSALRGRAGAARVEVARRALPALVATGAYLLRLAALVRRVRPDVVHSNTLKTHILTGLLSPALPALVWHLRDYVSSRPLVARVLQPVARGATCGIAISQSVAHDVGRALAGLPLEVAYDGIDVDDFSPGEGDGVALDRAGEVTTGAPGTVRIGLLAAYSRWKGHGVFLEAARMVARDLPQARFYVIGGPIYQTRGSQWTRDELVGMAQEGRELGGRVAFVPFQAEPVHAYRALDIVVHASTEPEPFGRTIVEGMACGRAVIASTLGGAAELFEDGVEALGVPPRRPERLASAMLELARDPGRRRLMGERARAAATGRFSRERLGRQMLDLYGRTRRGAP